MIIFSVGLNSKYEKRGCIRGGHINMDFVSRVQGVNPEISEVDMHLLESREGQVDPG